MPAHWTIDATPTDTQLREIASALTAGGVLLLPTDTIYGLHALANDAGAVERIANIKGRDDGKPFVVIGASIAQLEEAGVEFAASVKSALGELWPAPLTAILPLRRPVAASRGTSSLAVRVPAVAWLRQLLERTGPLASTSANRSGEPPVEVPDNLELELRLKLDGIVDAGRQAGQPSTLVELTGEPRFIREGDPRFSQKVWKSLRKTL